MPAIPPPPTQPPTLRGRALGALDRPRCEQQLRDAAIPFEPIASTSDVDQPLRLRGPLQGGFLVRQHGREPRVVRGRMQRDTRLDAIFDCRLVVALETWSSWAREAGFDTGHSAGLGIVPVVLGSSVAAARMAAALFEAGVNVQPILFPVVPERSARLRFFLSAEHTSEEVERGVAALVSARDACGSAPVARAG